MTQRIMRLRWAAWAATLSLSVCASQLVRPQPALAQSTPAGNANPSAAEVNAQLKAILTDSQGGEPGKDALKDEAARKLLARGTEDSLKILLDVLKNGPTHDAQAAVARALAADPSDDPRFIAPLEDLLGKDAKDTASAALALANYKGNADVLNYLTGFVQNRGWPQASRIAVVRALGTLFDKRAAENLIGFLQRPNETPAFTNAVCDALTEISGQNKIGNDPKNWLKWWDQYKNQSDQSWLTKRLDEGARDDAVKNRQLTHFSAAVQDSLTKVYLAGAPAQRKDWSMDWLRSNDAQVRVIALRILYNQVSDGEVPDTEVFAQIRGMIGDSSDEVRRQVAYDLWASNSEASAPLLAQLAVENDPLVRAAIAMAFSRISSPQTIAALLHLLDDPVRGVREQALDTLSKVGEQIRSDPRLMEQTTVALIRILDQTNADPDGPLREKVAAAMAQLRNPTLFQRLRTLSSTQNPANSERVRYEACTGLGQLNKGPEASYAADALGIVLANDPSPSVRLRAAQGLQSVATPAQLDVLYKHLYAGNVTGENDSSVRDACWDSLKKLFAGPSINASDLQIFADRFQNEPTRRVEVLKDLAAKHQADAQFKDLAVTQQSIGETCMTDAINDPEKAAIYFKLALSYWSSQADAPASIIDGLVRQEMEALLRARKYKEAVGFGSDHIKEIKAEEDQVNRTIVSEAMRLTEGSPKDVQDALDLIKIATTQATPPLRSTPQLKELEQNIREKLQRQNSARDRGAPP